MKNWTLKSWERERTLFKCYDGSQLLWPTNEKQFFFFKKLGLLKTTVSSLHFVCPFAGLKPIFKLCDGQNLVFVYVLNPKYRSFYCSTWTWSCNNGLSQEGFCIVYFKELSFVLYRALIAVQEVESFPLKKKKKPSVHRVKPEWGPTRGGSWAHAQIPVKTCTWPRPSPSKDVHLF